MRTKYKARTANLARWVLSKADDTLQLDAFSAESQVDTCTFANGEAGEAKEGKGIQQHLMIYDPCEQEY